MADILELALAAGFSHSGKVNMSALVALPEVREMCADDRCKSYGHSWSCPPACGSLEFCQKRMSAYSDGVLVQTTAQLEDDFDMEGIAAAAKLHKEHFDMLVRQAKRLLPGCLPLSAGTCTRCVKCTYPDRPCRFPSKLYSSMEAYGLFVSDVCKKSGMEYNYGPATITFSSCILY